MAEVCRLRNAVLFKSVGLIVKRDDPRVAQTVARLTEYLTDKLDTVYVDDEADNLVDLKVPFVDRATIAERCDLAIIVGGDGTFLNAARSLAESDIKLLGINMGRLGFLADVVPGEMTIALDRILSGDYEEEDRFLLDARVVRDGELVINTVALNDVVAHSGRIARLLEFKTFIDDRLVSQQRSDGLIVSTPTGSTAYALSSGGPLLHPTLNAMVLVPICPHTLSARPIVVDAESAIEIVLVSAEQREAVLTSDGQTTTALACGDRICIRKRSKSLILVHPPGYDYFAMLRTKLNWGRGI